MKILSSKHIVMVFNFCKKGRTTRCNLGKKVGVIIYKKIIQGQAGGMGDTFI